MANTLSTLYIVLYDKAIYTDRYEIMYVLHLYHANSYLHYYNNKNGR